MTGSAAAPRGAAAVSPIARPAGHPAVTALAEVGVLDEPGAATARATDISRAHPVWRVILADGRRLVVKAGLGHGGPDLAVECLVYRMTWWCEPLAAALPVPLVVDEDRQLLVLADVGAPDGPGSLAQQVGFPALLGSRLPDRPCAVPPTVARQLGETVGEVHRATAGFPLPPAPPPMVLALVGRVPSDLTDLADGSGRTPPVSAAVRQTLTDLSSRPDVAGAAAELRTPVAGCLVNHDLKWDNVVLGGPPGAVPRPVLLDWELAGLGDPAWDLGCLLAEHLVRASTLALDPAGTALLGGYRRGARLRAGVLEVFARRLALAAGLRIAQLALEVAYTPQSADPAAVTRLSDRAATVLAGAPALTEEVAGCLS